MGKCDCLAKWFREKIYNKKGAILVEVLGGITIFTITVVTFGAIIAQANLLSLRAEVTANEWERIFIEMENKAYVGMLPEESPDFSICLKLKGVNKMNIIDKDDKPLTQADDFYSTSGLEVTLMKDQRFYTYKMNASKMVAPGTGTVEVYRIDDAD